MDIKVDCSQDPARLELQGDLTKYVVLGAQHRLMGISLDKDVQINLSDVTDCDTAGLQLLIAFRNTLKKAGRNLTLDKYSPCVQKAADRVFLDLNIFR